MPRGAKIPTGPGEETTQLLLPGVKGHGSGSELWVPPPPTCSCQARNMVPACVRVVWIQMYTWSLVCDGSFYDFPTLQWWESGTRSVEIVLWTWIFSWVSCSCPSALWSWGWQAHSTAQVDRSAVRSTLLTYNILNLQRAAGMCCVGRWGASVLWNEVAQVVTVTCPPPNLLSKHAVSWKVLWEQGKEWSCDHGSIYVSQGMTV